MKQHEIAHLFEQIADLLEYQGANVFRVRAYRRGAQTLESFSGDLARLCEEKKLSELGGIGADLSAKIEEYLSTGAIKALDELKKKVPEGILHLLDVPGLGPKTAKLLNDHLKIDSLETLEAAATAGKLRDLPGFGAKKEENLLKGLGILRKGRERMHLGTALAAGHDMVAFLKSLPGVKQVSTAGSLRRMRETIGDLDVLVASAKPDAVIDAFQHSPYASRVLGAGTTKSSIVTPDGLQIDLRVVAPDSYGAALQYFTGSKEHNVRVRELAAKQGLKVNEYGVFKASTNRRVAGREEAEVYQAVGLAWMPPELREDRGEIEAAKTGKLPKLVELKDVRGDFHLHTAWSDGSESIEELVLALKKRGYQYGALTDHSQSLKVAHGMSIPRIRQQMKEVRALNERHAPFRLLMGSEVDILSDGSMDYPDEVLAELDFVVGSIHTGFTQSEAQLTKRMVTAMRNRYVTIIAHPTGRLMGQREGYPIDLAAAYRVAAETGTAMEINAYPRRLDLSDTAAREAQRAGVMLAVCTDTHSLDQLDHMAIGLGVARRAWLEPRHLLNCFTLRQLLTWIAKKRTKA